MATIRNARDKILQQSQTRLAVVTLSNNISVGQDQVQGLGLVVLASKLLFLSCTSQVFKIPTSGAATPTSIVFSASRKNLPGAVVWSCSAGGTLTLINGDQATLTYANMTVDSVVVTATVTENSTTYSDAITIQKLNEGADGIVGMLTNESQTLPADSVGNVTNYVGATGSFRVFEGITDRTGNAAVAYQVWAKSDPAISASINAAGTYSITGGVPVGVDGVTVTLRATYKGLLIDKVFSVTKSKAGAPALGMALSCNSQVFQVAKNGSVTPSGGIVFKAVQNGFAGVPAWTSTAGPLTSIPTDGLSATLLYSNMNADATTVRVTSASGTYYDEITIVKVREGSDSVQAFLSNESHALSSDVNGNNVNFTGATTTMSVYIGAVDTSASWSFSAAPSTGVSVSPMSGGTVLVTGMTVDQGYVDVTATRNGYANITKRLTLAKTKQGSQGNAGTGTQGPRGSMTFYVPIVGTSWTDAAADGAVVAPKTLNDVVTQYNNSQNFSQTRFWNGSAWVILSAIVDGNLLVSGTVGAAAFSANLMQADNVLTRGLTVRDTNGNVILSAGMPMNSGNMLINSEFLQDTVGWAAGSGAPTWGRNLDGTQVLGIGTAFMQQGVPINSSNDTLNTKEVYYNNPIFISTADTYEFSAYVDSHRCRYRLRLDWYDASNNILAGQQSVSAWFGPDNQTANVLSAYSRPFIIAKPPATAVKCYPVVQKADTQSGQTSSYVFWTRCMFAKTYASATQPSAYAQGSNYTNIKSSNVGNYVEPGAIGNTQIGGDLYSTNYAYKSTGWLLERSGNLWANNVYVRGNISGGNMSSWAWPAANQGSNGFYLGPEGLLLGNYNAGSWFQIYANGAVSSKNFSVDANGNASFNGAITARIVNTGQIVIDAVSTNVSRYNGGVEWYDAMEVQGPAMSVTGGEVFYQFSGEVYMSSPSTIAVYCRHYWPWGGYEDALITRVTSQGGGYMCASGSYSFGKQGAGYHTFNIFCDNYDPNVYSVTRFLAFSYEIKV